MGLPKRLTEMQMRFAELLVFGDEHGPLTKTAAAKRAGYSEKNARFEGSSLTSPKKHPLVVKYIGDIFHSRKHPLVVKYIGDLREELLRKHEVTYENHVAQLGKIREGALRKGAWSAAVNAETNRGKAAGLYIDRKIIKTGKLEDLSEQELEAKMKQILDDYSQIIDVTPSTTSESSLPIDAESSSDPQK